MEHLRELENVRSVVDNQLASDEDENRRDARGRRLRVAGDDLVHDAGKGEALGC
jgi:hypothetical protein